MTRSTMITLPDETADGAASFAAQRQRPLDELLADWIIEGFADRLVDELLRDLRPEEDVLFSNDQQQELVRLLAQDQQEALTNAQQIRLDELLRLYRQSLTQKAQSITEWLAAEALEQADVVVTELEIVRSSMLYAIGYDGESKTLEVVFNSGGIYRYHDVPPDVYQGLLAASSKGRYMWEHIFDLYPYERLRMRRARRS